MLGSTWLHFLVPIILVSATVCALLPLCLIILFSFLDFKTMKDYFWDVQDVNRPYPHPGRKKETQRQNVSKFVFVLIGSWLGPCFRI